MQGGVLAPQHAGFAPRSLRSLLNLQCVVGFGHLAVRGFRLRGLEDLRRSFHTHVGEATLPGLEFFAHWEACILTAMQRSLVRPCKKVAYRHKPSRRVMLENGDWTA